MIFQGGVDDREALTLGKRIAQESRVRLTVVHLTAANCEESEGWDKVLDSVMSRDIKTNGYMKL